MGYGVMLEASWRALSHARQCQNPFAEFSIHLGLESCGECKGCVKFKEITECQSSWCRQMLVHTEVFKLKKHCMIQKKSKQVFYMPWSSHLHTELLSRQIPWANFSYLNSKKKFQCLNSYMLPFFPCSTLVIYTFLLQVKVLCRSPAFTLRHLRSFNPFSFKSYIFPISSFSLPRILRGVLQTEKKCFVLKHAL